MKTTGYNKIKFNEGIDFRSLNHEGLSKYIEDGSIVNGDILLFVDDDVPVPNIMPNGKPAYIIKLLYKDTGVVNFLYDLPSEYAEDLNVLITF